MNKINVQDEEVFSMNKPVSVLIIVILGVCISLFLVQKTMANRLVSYEFSTEVSHDYASHRHGSTEDYPK